MPFQRIHTDGERRIDRTLTGTPPPPEPGVAQSEDGSIVASTADPTNIDPGTFVRVNLPGPREPVLDSSGHMSPRWYRFFTELYRRTGATQDNVNFVPAFRKLAPTGFTLAFTGAAPLANIAHNRAMGAGAAVITGVAPTVT